MKQSRFTDEQIIGFLKQAEAGMSVKELCRSGGFSQPMFYKWRSRFHVMALGNHRHTILIRPTQYPNNLFATESSLLHFCLHLHKSPFSQASIGSKFPGQVI